MNTEDKNIEKILMEAREKIIPPKELLSKIITNMERKRYSYREEGRPSIINIILNQIHNLMAPKLKLALALVVVLAIVGIFAYYQIGQKAPQYLTQEGQKLGALPKATGNVDDAITALMQDSASEEAFLLANDEEIASLVNLDSQAISDFGQSYNEI